jgi:hypothetical protein
VLPYEYQVRVDGNSTSLPQEMLHKYFETNQIAHVDALTSFRQQSAELFLPYDPMHLSSQGHAVLYEIIRGIVMRNDKISRANLIGRAYSHLDGSYILVIK